MNIHPTSLIEDGAVIGDGVIVGPMCQVGAHARLHDGVILKSHVVIDGDTEIGQGTIVHPFSTLGGPPQHLGYSGEATKLKIGENCIIRENVTVNIGTAPGGGITTIGDRAFLMVGTHVAHDCTVGDDVIFTTHVAVGGHVIIGDNAFLGGLCAIHQHCRIGDFAFVGGCATVTTDIIPHASAFGNHAKLAGLNIIGMKRRGMPRETIRNLRGAYRELFAETGTFKERVDLVRQNYSGCDEVARILSFIDSGAARPLMTPGR